METKCSSEMSINIHRTTGCYIPEDKNLEYEVRLDKP
jgi:hypothetical protein